MGFQHTNSYRQCTAKSKRSKHRCKNAAMRGRKVCRLHGGKSHKGFNSESHTHGYYSKDWYSRFIWSRLKDTWRDSILSLRIARVRCQYPDKMSTAQRKQWEQATFKIIYSPKPIPDIPPSLYQALWDSHSFTDSSAVRKLIKDYLGNDAIESIAPPKA